MEKLSIVNKLVLQGLLPVIFFNSQVKEKQTNYEIKKPNQINFSIEKINKKYLQKNLPDGHTNILTSKML